MTYLDHIAVMGAGNVGWNLVHRMLARDIAVKEVISDSAVPEDWNSPQLDIRTTDEGASPEATLLLVCVPDDHVQSIALSQRSDLAVAHTSGSTPLIDRPLSGVCYPFQTFTRHRIPSWDGIPFFVECNDDGLERDLLQLGQALSGNAELKHSDQRKIIHMAGVFGANFVNHILHLADDVLDRGDTSFDVLRPLLEEVVAKAVELGPKASQTGPARRGDKAMIQAHLDALNDRPEVAEIYRLLSENIRKTHST